MEVVLNRDAFLKGLQMVQNIVEPRQTLPILANVLLETDGEAVRLTATDLEVGARVAVPARVAAVLGKIVLKRAHFKIPRRARLDAFDRRDGAGEGRVIRNFLQERGPAQRRLDQLTHLHQEVIGVVGIYGAPVLVVFEQRHHGRIGCRA